LLGRVGGSLRVRPNGAKGVTPLEDLKHAIRELNKFESIVERPQARETHGVAHLLRIFGGVNGEACGTHIRLRGVGQLLAIRCKRRCACCIQSKAGLTPHSSQVMWIQLPLVYLIFDTVCLLCLDAVAPYCRQPARARSNISSFLCPADVGENQQDKSM
jgi:hypothetical protein